MNFKAAQKAFPKLGQAVKKASPSTHKLESQHAFLHGKQPAPHASRMQSSKDGWNMINPYGSTF
jgi:hypothetical protein